MAWPRLVFGETTRERELRAIADANARHAERLLERLKAEESECFKVKSLLGAEKAAADGLTGMLKAAVDERDTAIAERNAGRVERDDLAGRLKVAERNARATRGSLMVIAQRLRQFATEIEPGNDSQDDHAATDGGAEGVDSPEEPNT